MADASEVGRYWSVDECRWMDCPRPAVEGQADVRPQRDAEPAQEPADA